MYLSGTDQQIMTAIRQQHPEIDEVLKRVRTRVPHAKREIAEYQAAALYALTRPYNRAGACILEIGTFWGYSTAIMAEAAPLAEIITLNPKEHEVDEARTYLSPYRNVRILCKLSWDYLMMYDGPLFDLIFIDGDHKRIARDLPWWEWVAPDGAMLFHDYSPAGTYRECPPVYEGLNRWAEVNRHPLDVLIVDDGGGGFAGFYKNGR